MSEEKQSSILRRGASLFVVGIVAIIIVGVAAEMGIFAKVGINLGVVQLELEPQNTQKLTGSEIPTSQESLKPEFGNFAQGGGCSYDAYGFELPFPDQWYGPIGDGYWIAYSSFGGFQVADPFYNSYSFPDPGGSIQRDEWIPLESTPFDICVDSNNYVYSRFNF